MFYPAPKPLVQIFNNLETIEHIPFGLLLPLVVLLGYLATLDLVHRWILTWRQRKLGGIIGSDFYDPLLFEFIVHPMLLALITLASIAFMSVATIASWFPVLLIGILASEDCGAYLEIEFGGASVFSPFATLTGSRGVVKASSNMLYYAEAEGNRYLEKWVNSYGPLRAHSYLQSHAIQASLGFNGASTSMSIAYYKMCPIGTTIFMIFFVLAALRSLYMITKAIVSKMTPIFEKTSKVDPPKRAQGRRGGRGRAPKPTYVPDGAPLQTTQPGVLHLVEGNHVAMNPLISQVEAAALAFAHPPTPTPPAPPAGPANLPPDEQEIIVVMEAILAVVEEGMFLRRRHAARNRRAC